MNGLKMWFRINISQEKGIRSIITNKIDNHWNGK